MIEVKAIKHGQYRPYDDTHIIFEIHTDEQLSDDTILKLCNETGRLPYEEWKSRIGNMGDYFKGWYKITPTDYGYLYEGLYPYDD